MRLCELSAKGNVIAYLLSDDADVIEHAFNRLKAACKDGFVVPDVDFLRVSNICDDVTYVEVDELNSRLEKWRKKAKKIEERSKDND